MNEFYKSFVRSQELWVLFCHTNKFKFISMSLSILCLIHIGLSIQKIYFLVRYLWGKYGGIWHPQSSFFRIGGTNLDFRNRELPENWTRDYLNQKLPCQRQLPEVPSYYLSWSSHLIISFVNFVKDGTALCVCLDLRSKLNIFTTVSLDRFSWWSCSCCKE